MQVTPPRRWPLDVGWIVLWGLASSAWCLSASPHLSATFDEPFYIQEGLKGWRSGSNDRFMRAGTMPLPVDVQTLPLYVWERLRGEAFDVEADFARLLPVARAGNLVFWWLLLVYAYRLARLSGGAWAGRIAVATCACEPNLLAHATLATTDVAVTACLLAFLYHFVTRRDDIGILRLGLPTLWFALAVCAKASAIAFGGLAMFAAELVRLVERGELLPPGRSTLREKVMHLWGVTGPFREDLWRIVTWGMVLVFLYCGTDFKPQGSFVKWTQSLPEGTPRSLLQPVAENLRVFPNAAEAIMYQFKHNLRGHGVFLMGDWQRRAVWYYFPVALAFKLTLPLLVTLGLLLCGRRRTLWTPMGVLAGVLFLFSLNCRVQIGIRLMLPLVALAVVAVAAALAQAGATLPRRGKQGLSVLVILAALLPAIRTWPDGLVFFNPLGGGSEAGYRLLNDSNYDWGQGLPELRQWQAAHFDKPLRVWYYGMDPDVRRGPLILTQLHALPIESEADAERVLSGSVLAVSTTILHGDPSVNAAWEHCLRLLRSRTPIGRTRTYFLYDFSP